MTKRWCRRWYHRLTLYHVPVDSTWRALVRFIITGVAQADIPLDLYENLDKSLQQKCLHTCGSPLKYLIKAARGQNSQSTYCTFILGLFVLLWYSCLFCNTNGPVCTTNMYYLWAQKRKKWTKTWRFKIETKKWKQQQRYWVCCCENYTWFNIQRLTGKAAYHVNRIRPSAQAESCWATSFWWSA